MEVALILIPQRLRRPGVRRGPRRCQALNPLVVQAEEENSDVTIVREGILHPAMMVAVVLTYEEATAEGVNTAARRTAEVAEQVKAGRGGVKGVTVELECGETEGPRGLPRSRPPERPADRTRSGDQVTW